MTVGPESLGVDQINVASWNIKGGLSDPKRARSIVDLLIERQDDFIAIPDAWHEDSERSIASSRRLLVSPNDFLKEGYKFTDAWFEENRPDDNSARFHFVSLIRVEHTATPQELRLGTRPGISLDLSLGATTLKVVALYLNDQSMNNRITQVSDLQEHLHDHPQMPTMLMGDFNDIHRDARFAKILRSTAFRSTFGKLSVANHVFPYLADMAEGAAVHMLENEGFADTDPDYRATMPSYYPLFQLDRFMLRDPNKEFVVTPVERISKPFLSDHQLIATSVRAVRQR